MHERQVRDLWQTFGGIAVLGSVALTVCVLAGYEDGIVSTLMATSGAVGMLTALGLVACQRRRPGAGVRPAVLLVAGVSAAVPFYLAVGSVTPMPG